MTNDKLTPPVSTESIAVDFHCPVAGKPVKIEREYIVRISRAGKRLGKDLTETDCSEKGACRIAVRDGPGMRYDWARCAYLHPEAA